MKISDLFEETYSAILSNKARSGLTILGIVIGIGSVIAMISIGQGAQGSIESNIQALGSNLIMITPGAQRGAGVQVSSGRGSAQSLSMSDVEAIQNNIDSIKNVAPENTGNYQITAKGTNTRTRVVGVTATYSAVRNIEVADGSFIVDQNTKSTSKVAVIGPTTRDDLFGVDATNVIGQTIRIKGIEFKVVGVTKSKGGTGFGSQDDVIYVPLTTAQRFLSGNNYLTTINVQAIDQDSMTALQSEITSLLLDEHHIADATLADFSIMNQADIAASASSITNTLTILLGSIAGISLVVGGIGIMNMMLTTVTERTREIGLRKSIGAKRKDITFQFLSEAVMLTFLGGIFGVILGWILSSAVSKFGGITTKISLFSVLLAFGVSALIGILFGYYPAKRAAKLNPIEALRYE
ncbi:MAG: ABC transporter permease [Patescibacteria group bacterium]